ncbi:hypothetical protein, partial [Ureaplasma diversum]|uniref:hypothetical protein n=1 Tax=Ureaplasma diversum TaxID=42094 RepID=UPI00056EC354
ESNSAPSLSTTPMISSELFNDGIVYKDLSNQLVYKKNVGSGFNLKEMTLTVNDVTNSQTYQIFGVVRDNVASFKLSNLQSGKFVVKKLQSKEQDKQVDIKEIEFEYIAKPETPFTINKGKTTLEIKVPQAKQNDYYYAIFKGDDGEEYKVLSQTQENKANYFDVGVLSKISKDQQYHLERVESNEINTLEKTRRVVIQNNGLRQELKTKFNNIVGNAELNDKKLELQTNNDAINYLLSPIAIEQPNNKIIRRYLVVEFKDDLHVSNLLVGKYENNKFVFDTSELPVNHLWTLNKFFIKEENLSKTENNNNESFQDIEIKLNKPIYVINNDDTKEIDEELKTKLQTVDINTLENKAKTFKFYNPKLAGKKVKLHLNIDNENSQTIELELTVDNSLVATLDVSKENKLEDNKKYIITKISSDDASNVFDISSLSNIEKHFYKNKFLLDVQRAAFEGGDFDDLKVVINNLSSYITDENKKFLNFVFEYQGKIKPTVNIISSNNHQIKDEKLLDAKEHEKVEKSFPLKDINQKLTNEAIVKLSVPYNRHFRLKRIELKYPTKTLLLFKNEQDFLNLWNSYAVEPTIKINHNDNVLQVDLLTDKPKKHINTHFTIYFKTTDNKIKMYNDNIPANFDATGQILYRKILLSNIGFDIKGATVLAVSLDDEFKEKIDILGQEIPLNKA